MEEYLRIAILAAIEAGEAIMEVYATDFDVETKGDDSPLTSADRKANAVINRWLEQTPFPIISEENKQIPYEERADWASCWIVDPLDGTKEFIKRNGEFTVNIAWVKNGNPMLGVIYVPVSKTLYFTGAEANQAFKAQLEDTGIPVKKIMEIAIEIHPSEKEGKVIRVVGSRSHLNDDTKAFISDIAQENEVEIVSKGSSLKFCLVAEGEAHVYPRYAPTMEWDTAAGQAICQAAGVRVLEEKTRLPLRYNKKELLNPYFLVQS